MEWAWISRAIASIAICAASAYCNKITQGKAGLGWMVIGLLLVWGSAV